MRLRTTLTLLALTLGTIGGLAADLPDNCRVADEHDPAVPEDDDVVCEQRVYFHCADDRIKVANVTNFQDGPAQFDTTPPESSVADGAGCGTVDTVLEGTSDHNPLYDAPFEGFFMGEETANIESLAVIAYVEDLGLSRAGEGDFIMKAHVVIDGRTVLSRDVEFTPEVTDSNDGATRTVSFTVTGINNFALDDADDLSYVQITLYSRYVDTNQGAWVFDTTEVPAGLMFNPVTPIGRMVSATG